MKSARTGGVAITRPTRDQWLIWEVEAILAGCGLSQIGASVSGGVNHYLPRVVPGSLVREDPTVPGKPTTLTIKILPGQDPSNYSKHTQTIAYNLGINKVTVVPLGPYLIGLRLWPDPTPGGELPRPPPWKGLESGDGHVPGPDPSELLG